MCIITVRGGMVMKKIRKLEHVGDVDGVERVAKNAWRATYKNIMDEEFIEEFISLAYSKKAIESRARDTIFYVVEDQEQIVGFVNYFPNYFGPNQTILAAIYVEPEYQRCGIGTLLMNHVLNVLPEKTKLFADIERDNKIGRSFFEKRGFYFHKNIEHKIGNYQINRVRVMLESSDVKNGNP